MSAPNQQHPLPSSPGVTYRPYQSHRRTASARSSISTASTVGTSSTLRQGVASSTPSTEATFRRLDGTGSRQESPAPPLPSAISSPPPLAAPSVATPLSPSPLSRQHDSLDAPPPLRRLQSRIVSSASSNANASQPGPSSAAAAQGRSLAKSLPRPAPDLEAATPRQSASSPTNQQFPSQSIPQHKRSPSLPPSSPDFSSLINSTSRNASGVRVGSVGSGNGHARSQTLTSVPSHLDRHSFQVPVAKGMSTSQALRMKELQEHSSSGSRSGGSSAGGSAQSSRAQSPASAPAMARNGGSGSSTSMAGFDAMFAAQQQKTSASRTASPLIPSSRSGSFQPRGVTRSQLPDFLESRRATRIKKRQQRGGSEIAIQDQDREEERIRRRVEKLLAIHYPSTSEAPMISSLPTSNSFSSSLLSTLAPHSRFFNTLQRTSNLRAAEQSLVPWQTDDVITACPLCMKSFGVGRRKHHCRACGRVVCASPEIVAPSHPSTGKTILVQEKDGQPASKCSNIVIRDERAIAAANAVGGGGGAAAAGEAMLAIKDLPPDLSLDAFLSQSTPGQVSTAASKSALEASQQGFRLCRDCKAIVLRGHYLFDEGEAPEYIRLYEQLSQLQGEIEQSLPEFQELVMGLQKQDVSSTLGVETGLNGTTASPPHSPSTSRQGSAAGTTLSRAALLQLQRDAATARKQLLANFANYDALARRIRDLPDGGNNSLKRIKEGVDRKAAAFLQMNMFPLQSLPKLDSNPSTHKRSPSHSGSNTPSTKGPGPGPGSASANAQEQEQLAVLTEQHAQITSFLERAQRERKLNDVVLLKRNLDELQKEMNRLRMAHSSLS